MISEKRMVVFYLIRFFVYFVYFVVNILVFYRGFTWIRH